jgi:mRNA interferase HicA
VKGSEFLRKARRAARSRELTYRWVPSHGKGSHGTLYVGTNGKTTVQHLRREIPSGTLRAMIDQLELEPKDFGLS